VNSDETLEAVEKLVDAWCGRRDLAPLRHVLPSFPLTNPLTDGWADLLRALEEVRACCRDRLPESELETIQDCIVAVQRIVYR